MSSLGNFKLYSRRFLVAAALICNNTVLYFSFLTFAPLSNLLAGPDYFGVDVQLVNMVALSLMIAYPLASPVGSFFLSAFGLRRTIITTAAVMTVGHFGRWGAAFLSDGHLSMSIIVGCQFLVAFVAPASLNLASKVASDWFGVGEIALLLYTATMMSQLGNALASILPPYLVHDMGAVRQLLLYQAVAAVLTLLMAVAFVQDYPPTAPSASALLQREKEAQLHQLLQLDEESSSLQGGAINAPLLVTQIPVPVQAYAGGAEGDGESEWSRHGARYAEQAWQGTRQQQQYSHGFSTPPGKASGASTSSSGLAGELPHLQFSLAKMPFKPSAGDAASGADALPPSLTENSENAGASRGLASGAEGGSASKKASVSAASAVATVRMGAAGTYHVTAEAGAEEGEAGALSSYQLSSGLEEGSSFALEEDSSSAALLSTPGGRGKGKASSLAQPHLRGQAEDVSAHAETSRLLGSAQRSILTHHAAASSSPAAARGAAPLRPAVLVDVLVATEKTPFYLSGATSAVHGGQREDLPASLDSALAAAAVTSSSLSPEAAFGYGAAEAGVGGGRGKVTACTWLLRHFRDTGLAYWQLLHNRAYVIMVLSFSITVGLGWSLGALIAQLLAPCAEKGGAGQLIGIAGAASYAVGIVSGLVMGPIAQRWPHYKLLLRLFLLLILLSWVFVFSPGVRGSFLLCVVAYSCMGAVTQPIIPNAIELTMQLTYPVSPDKSTGLMFISTNIFSACISLALGKLLQMEASTSCSPLAPANTLVVCLMALAFLTSLFVRGEYRKAAVDKASSAAAAAAVFSQAATRSGQ